MLLRIHSPFTVRNGITQLAVLVLSFILLGSATNAQQACSNIENDIQRLECFDAQLSEGDNATLPPDKFYEVFQSAIDSAFKESGSSKIHVIKSVFYAKECVLGIANWHYKVGYYYPAVVLNMYFIPLADVASHSKGFSVLGNGINYDLEMNRGKNLYIVSYTQESKEIDNLATAEQTASNMLVVGKLFTDQAAEGGEVEQVSTGLRASINLTTEESRVAADEIVKSFSDLIQSCQS